MEIRFLGATGTVTGSKYLVRSASGQVLVDCGLFQGVKDWRVRNRQPLPLDPAGIDATPPPKPEKPQREIDAADAIVMLREEGIHDGIAAFGIPGSHPPKSGILVPEEFELPEGYVRHYQSTDDGEQLPAILMFHPDYELVNEAGQVVRLPEDGIVPPEMAPPGLKTDQVLEVPERKRGEPLR